jgi:hypothetical protein
VATIPRLEVEVVLEPLEPKRAGVLVGEDTHGD